jgi:hypothetical protein
LHDDTRLFHGYPETLQHQPRHQCHTSAGGLTTTGTAAQRHRLAGHDRRFGMPALAFDFFQEPAHRSVVGIHIRRGNIHLRPDKRRQRPRVCPSEQHLLAGGERPWVAGNPALRAAKWQVEQRALPGHEVGQPPHLVQVHTGMNAETTLRRIDQA